MTTEPAESSGPGISLWKKALLALSLLLMASGAVARGYVKFIAPAPAEQNASQPAAAPSAPATGAKPLPPGARGFLGSDSGTTSSAAGDAQIGGGNAATTPAQNPTGIDWNKWSPALFRSGFSFFAGFCIAYALKTVFKVGVIICGVVLIAMFALQYAGLLNIDWNSISGHYNTFTAWFEGQFGSFKDFITGHLPTAGAAVAGMAVGIMR